MNITEQKQKLQTGFTIAYEDLLDLLEKNGQDVSEIRGARLLNVRADWSQSVISTDPVNNIVFLVEKEYDVE